MVMKNRKNKVELESVVLKVNGELKTFTKDQVSFSASEQECDTCGSHGEVTLTVYEEKKSYDVEVASW